MRTGSTLTLVVVAVTMFAATTAGGALAPTATAATSPVEQSAAQTFCADVNHERGARGLGALRCTYNGVAQSAVESHQDRTDVWIPLAPNPAYATIAFMQSDGHRYSLTAPNATVMDVGVSCASYPIGDGTTDFGMYLGANFDQHPTAPSAPNPIVTASDNSSPCGTRTSPPTNPPPPPATAAPQPVAPAQPAPSPGASNGSGSGSHPAAPGSTAGPGQTSPTPGSPSTTIPGSPKDSSTVPGSSATTTSGAHHKALAAKGRHSQGGPSSGAPHGTVTPPGSSSPGGHLSWWWALVPVGGLGLLAGLLVARRIHQRTT